jgi:Rrf2 family protein
MNAPVVAVKTVALKGFLLRRDSAKDEWRLRALARRALLLTDLVNYVIISNMKLSTKSTYGLRAMLNVAMKDGDDAVSIMDIAKAEGISVSYLEQLLNKLRHEGLIESIRGPNGGYLLSRDADEITVADIVKALEGNIYPVHCVGSRRIPARSCKRSSACVPKTVWLKLARAIDKCLSSITLDDLCAEARKIKGVRPLL